MASGFVEPLEATGIAWFVTCSETLSKLLKNRYYDEDIIKRYNSLITMYVEDVQDFVDVHYSLSNRNDTEFWKYQTSRPRHGRLQARLDSYRKSMPNKNNRSTDYPWAFNDISWLDILNAYEFQFDDVKVPESYDFMRMPELFVRY